MATKAGIDGAERRRPLAVRLALLGGILLGFAAGYALGLHRYVSLEALAAKRDMLGALVGAHPVASAAIFFCIYVAIVAFSFPAASVLTIFGGFLFGWVVGGLLVVCAATIGACILFGAARTVFGDTLRRRAGPFLDRFAPGFERNAFQYLLVLRLAPVFPFFIVNIAPAFSGVSLKTFAAATLIGILPGTFVYAWLGSGLDGAIASAKAQCRSLSISDFATTELTLAFLALAAIAALPLVLQAFKGKTPASPGSAKGP